jgi:hypothetical protein
LLRLSFVGSGPHSGMAVQLYYAAFVGVFATALLVGWRAGAERLSIPWMIACWLGLTLILVLMKWAGGH